MSLCIWVKNTFLSFSLLKKNKSKFNQDERKIIDFGSNGGFVLLLCGEFCIIRYGTELNGLNNEYELGTLEVSDNGLKCETLGDEDSIQVLKDNYIAEIMGRMEVAKEKVMRTAYGATSPRVGVFRVGSCGNYKYLSIKIDCENGNSKTSVSGNVGDTYVDGGDNMRLEFCMVDAGFRYPGESFCLRMYL